MRPPSAAPARPRHAHADRVRRADRYARSPTSRSGQARGAAVAARTAADLADRRDRARGVRAPHPLRRADGAGRRASARWRARSRRSRRRSRGRGAGSTRASPGSLHARHAVPAGDRVHGHRARRHARGERRDARDGRRRARSRRRRSRSRTSYPRGAVRPDAPLAIDLRPGVDRDAIAKSLHVETGDKHRQLAFKPIDARRREAAVGAQPEPRARRQAPRPALRDPRAGRVVVACRASTARSCSDVGAPSKRGPAAHDQGARELVLDRAGIQGRGHHVHVRQRARADRRRGVSDPELRRAPVQQPDRARLVSRRRRSRSIARTRSGRGQQAARAPRCRSPCRRSIGRTYGVTIGDGIVDELGQPLVGPHHALVHDDARALRAVHGCARAGSTSSIRGSQIPQWVVGTQAVGSLRVQLYRGRAVATTSRSRSSRPASARRRRASASTTRPYTVGARYRRPIASICGPRSTRRRPATSSRSRPPSTARWRAPTRARSRGSRSPGSGSSRASTASRRRLGPDIAPDRLPRAARGCDRVAPRPGSQRSAGAPSRPTRTGHAAFELAPYVEAKPAKPNEPERTALLVVKSGADSAFPRSAATRRRCAAHNALLVRHRRSIHVQAGREGLRQGLDPVDAQRRRSRSRAAGQRRHRRVHAAATRRATSSPPAPRSSRDQGGFDLEVDAAREPRGSARPCSRS